MNNLDRSDLLEKLDYTFKNEALFEQALTHTSYANEKVKNKPKHYERLEFLGDAVLEQIVSEFLYFKYPKFPEGRLTRLRASLVCEFTLSQCSRQIGLGEYVLLSKGEDQTGGRNRDSILCDLFEAMLGAIYLDGGIEPAKKYVITYLLDDIEGKTLFYDAKSTLQEITQRDYGEGPVYELLEASGPDHNRHFVTAVMVAGKEMAKGEGTSKKNAEQMAAYEALKILKGLA